MTAPIVIEACPFCGYRPVVMNAKFIQKPQRRFALTCGNEKCEVKVQTKWVPTLIEAFASWNHRITLPSDGADMVSSTVLPPS